MASGVQTGLALPVERSAPPPICRRVKFSSTLPVNRSNALHDRHSMPGGSTLKISEIRALIYALRCNRNALSGLPDAEFERTDVPARLNPFIEACKAVVIAPKFKQDIENRRVAVEKADSLIPA